MPELNSKRADECVATVRSTILEMTGLESAAFDALAEFYPGEVPTRSMLKTLSFILYKGGGDNFMLWLAQTQNRGVEFKAVTNYLFGIMKNSRG